MVSPCARTVAGRGTGSHGTPRNVARRTRKSESDGPSCSRPESQESRSFRGRRRGDPRCTRRGRLVRVFRDRRGDIHRAVSRRGRGFRRITRVGGRTEHVLFRAVARAFAESIRFDALGSSSWSRTPARPSLTSSFLRQAPGSCGSMSSLASRPASIATAVAPRP